MSNDRFSRLADRLRKNAKEEVTKQINGALPAALRVNPSDLDDDDDDDDDDDEGDDDEGDDDEGGGSIDDEGGGSIDDEDGGSIDDEDADNDIESLCFDYPDKERNQASAVAAYRALGDEKCVIVFFDNGQAFFGTVEDCKEYCKKSDIDPESCDVYDDAEEIMAMPYDKDAVQRVLRLHDEHEDAYTQAKKQYEEFHWGDKSKTTVIKDIEGVNGPLMAMGIGRRIEYGAQKEGKWEEYYHLFGEESDTYPTVYGLGPVDAKGHYRTIVIHGGNMHIEDRGIVD